MGVEGDGHKVQRPRGAGDAKSEEKEMDYLLEAALDFWAKNTAKFICNNLQFSSGQTDGGWTGRKNIMYCINWP